MSAGVAFTLDPSYRRPAHGRTIVAGSPLKLFRVTGRGLATIEAIERGHDTPPGSDAFINRLLDAGAIHPRFAARGHRAAELTIVIPAHGELPQLRSGACRTILVDDGSSPPLSSDTLEVVRLDANRGPAAARNAGLARVETPFVAFVDTDVAIDESGLVALLGHFDDPKVALVAPRVMGPVGGGALERYEATRSPLDLGPEPARIAPGTRVSYVPAAAIVCRVDAVRGIGGFDESLRYGEDVDMVWRLAATGWRCRYEPAVVARHRTRTSLAAWVEQRVHYGGSAAPLARRHPGALAPVRMSGWSALTWAAIAAGAVRTGAVIGLGTTVALVRKLRDLPAAESVRLAGLGHLYAGRLLVGTMRRAWWPAALLLATVSKRARRTLAVAATLDVLADWRRERPDLDAVTYSVLRTLDDAAYGAGVWIGSLRHSTADALLPSFAPWPPR